MSVEDRDAELLVRANQVFGAWLARSERGGAEPFSELLERHPDLGAMLARLKRSDAALRAALPERQDDPVSTGARSKMLGDFKVLRELGRGAMGIVFEAEQVSLRRRVALKVLPAHLTLNERFLQRFQREAEITGRLHHPNIVAIHQIGEVAGVHYIAMELVEGTSLDHVIERMRRESFEAVRQKKIGDVVSMQGLEQAALPGTGAARPESGRGSGSKKGSSSASNKNYIETAVKLVCQVADALDHAHQAGVIHRDVKPSNILVRPDGSAVLTDFGLAQEQGLPGVSRTGDFAGTPNFVSPEQAMSGRVPIDHRTDVFSLGATLYELLTLELAFAGDNVHEVLARILSKQPPDPQKLNPALAPDLVTIVLKALEKDPDRRYASAGELAADLRAFIEYRPIRARRTPTVMRAWRWARREPLKAGMIGVLGIGVPLVAWLSLQVSSQRKTVAAQVEENQALQAPRLVDQAFLALGIGDPARAQRLFEEVLAADPALLEAAAGQAMALLAQDEAGAALTALGAFGASPALDRLRVDALRRTDAEREASELEASLAEPSQPLERYIEAVRLIHDRPFLSGTPRGSLLLASAGRRPRPEAGDSTPGAPEVRWSDEEQDTLVAGRERARRAIEHLSRAIAGDSARAYDFAWAWAAWLAREPKEASRAADAILHKWPELPMACFFAGLASEVFDVDRALELYDQALRDDPLLAPAQERRAILFLDRGDRERAIEDLQALVERDPERASHRVNLAVALIEAGEAQEAIRCARQARERDPDFVPAFDALGTAYLTLGKLEEAREAFQAAVELEPNGARLHNDLGLVLLELGEAARAEEELEEALRLDREQPFAAYNLGILHTRARRFDEAIEFLERAIELEEASMHPEFPVDSAWGALGAAYVQRGETEEAIAAFQEAVARRPDDAEHNANLGVELYRLAQDLEQGSAARTGDFQSHRAAVLQRYEQCAGPLEKGLPSDTDGKLGLHRHLIEALRKLGRLEEALAFARAWTERFPESADAWHQRAWIQVDPDAEPVGDAQDGLRSAEELRRLSGEPTFGVLDTYGCALFRSGRAAEAAEAVYQALELAPRQGAKPRFLAQLQAHLTRFEAAVQ